MYFLKALLFTAGNFQTFKHQCLLDVTDLDWGSNAEPWIDGLSECGLEPVQEGHAAGFYTVESQHACRVVQVHTYPGGVRSVDGRVHAVVPGWVARVGTQEAPGLVVVAQQTQRAFALPADASVGHANGELAAPLNLPVVAASRQSLTAQHLSEAVEPLLVVWVGLQVPGADDLPAVLGDVELLVGRVGVQLELTKVCRRRMRSLSSDANSLVMSWLNAADTYILQTPLCFLAQQQEGCPLPLCLQNEKKNKINILSGFPTMKCIYILTVTKPGLKGEMKKFK